MGVRAGLTSYLVGSFLLLSAGSGAAAPAITMSGVTHLTLSDGSAADTLDLVIPGVGSPFSEVRAAVTGPGGFHYEFSAADLVSWPLDDSVVLSKTFPSLQPGLYTFQVADFLGHETLRTDAHDGGHRLPVADSATFQQRRLANGSYRFSWAPVDDARTYYYRLRVLRLDGTVTYASGRSPTTFQEVAAGTLQDGVTYEWLVDVVDAQNFDLLFNRSESAPKTFVPSVSDYDARRVFLKWWAVENRVEADGSVFRTADFAVPDAGGVTLAEDFGPDGSRYVFDPATDLLPGGEFFRSFPGDGVRGVRRIHFVANGLDQEAFATLTPPVRYPVPNPSTCQAEALADGKIRFSWAGVDFPGALYYRVRVQDSVSGVTYTTARTSAAFADVDPSALASLGNRRWRVEVYDSPNVQTSRNRTNGPWVPLTVAAFDPGRPAIASFQMRRRLGTNGDDRTDLWFQASDADGTLEKLWVQGPEGYTRDLLLDGKLFLGLGYQGYQVLENVPPTPGLYTFTAVDNEGKTRLAYDLQPAPVEIPAVDYRSIRVGQGQSGDLYVTWAAVSSDVPVWYGVDFFTVADLNGDGSPDEVFTKSYLQQTSCTIPAGSLPADPLMFRIQVRDAGTGTLVNNRRHSVMLGYEGPGFAYGQLADADADGFANNADTDDADPGVYPSAAPSYTLSDYLTLADKDIGTTFTYAGEPGVSGQRRLRIEGRESVAGVPTWRMKHEGVAIVGGTEYPFAVYSYVTLDGNGWSEMAIRQPPDPMVVYPAPRRLLAAQAAEGDVQEFVVDGNNRRQIALVGSRSVSVAGYEGPSLLVRVETLGTKPFTEHWYLAPGLGTVKSTTFGAQNGFMMGSATLTSVTPDRPPVLAALSDQTVEENHTLTFEVSASDPDGDPATVTVSDLPEGATFTKGTFSWTPGDAVVTSPAASANFTVTFTATAGGKTDVKAVKVTVTAAALGVVTPPLGLTVPATSTTDTYPIKWKASKFKKVTYELEEATDVAFTQGRRVAYAGTKTSAVVSMPPNNATYYYRVRAVRDQYTPSEWVAGAGGCAVRRDAATPAKVTVPKTSKTGAFKVTWSASKTKGVAYELQEATDPAFTQGVSTVYTGAARSLKVENRLGGATYYYRLKASREGYNPTGWVAGANGCAVPAPGVRE